MKMQICARCKKRPAMVFISRIEKDKTINEGICLQCASELGIKPVNDMLSKMGIDEDAIRNMSAEINDLIESVDPTALEAVEDNGADDPRVPTLNLGELFGMPMRPPRGEKGNGKGKKDEKASPEKKALNSYCTNLNEKARQGKIDRIVG